MIDQAQPGFHPMSGAAKMPGKNASLMLLLGLAVIVALLGGSSNPRVPQLVGLRPLVALFLIPVLYYWHGIKSAQEKTIAYLFLGIAAWTALQLVPLPQWAWAQLPDRDLIVELDQTLGLGSQWRPLSWVPSRGINALAAMIVPAAALLLAITLRARNETLLQILLGIALLNSLMAIVQVVSGNPESLYLYDPRSNGSDGLFGNENHSGVFSALGLLIAARLGAQGHGRNQPWLQLVYGVVALVIFLAVLIGGSRAGLAAGAGATIGAIIMITMSIRNAKGTGTSATSATARRRFLSLTIVALASIAALFFWLERSPSFDGILSESTLEGLRSQLNPVLLEMVGRNWLFGTGFGSFEEYYHIYEPTELLLPKFINLAHNDWLQFALEGGIVAVALLILMFGWVVRQLTRLFSRGGDALYLVVFWIAVFGVIGSASLVDYPMRTPIFLFAFAWLMLCLARDGAGSDLGEPGVSARSRSRKRRR